MSRRTVGAAVLAALLALSAGCGRSHPADIPGVKKFTGLSHEHVTKHVDYEQTPPVGGPHFPKWLTCSGYANPVPNEAAVHSMEHGAVWVTYRPELPQAEIVKLRALLAVNPAYVLLSPYPGLPSPVVASTWGLQLAVDRADDERLADFVRRYAGGNQGGEGGAPCRGGLSPDEARAQIGR